jgi:hypothetical protein
VGTIRVSILVDIDTDNEDLESFRSDLLDAVVRDANLEPDLFLLKELDPDDESDWDEIEDHKEVSAL